MKCPHCTVEIHAEWNEGRIAENPDSFWNVRTMLCPSCSENIIYLEQYPKKGNPKLRRSYMAFPRAASRPLAAEIPEKYSKPFHQAVEVLPISPEASAAISRRTLQLLLRDEAYVKHGDLFDEIDEVIKSGKLPTHLTESIDAIRNAGNFGSHPIKSKNTGEIIEVEPGEAEWLLDTLEDLYDFYIVQPAKTKQKRDALNKKLQDAGKSPMK